jgi:hypothetical protein
MEELATRMAQVAFDYDPYEFRNNYDEFEDAVTAARNLLADEPMTAIAALLDMLEDSIQ